MKLIKVRLMDERIRLNVLIDIIPLDSPWNEIISQTLQSKLTD